MPLYSTEVFGNVFALGGLRRIQYAVVDTEGCIMGPTGTIAQGSNRGMGMLLGAKRAGGQAPAPRQVDQSGDDGKWLMSWLFAANAIGELALMFEPYDTDFLANVTGTKVESIGEWKATGEETDADPQAATICLLFNIQAKDADTEMGTRRWCNLFYPLVNLQPQFSNHEEATATEWPFTGKPNRAASWPWLQPFTSAGSGFKRAVKRRMFTEKYPLTMHTHVGNASNKDIFVDYTPSSDDTGSDVMVFQEGVQLTKTTQFTVSPGAKKVSLVATPAAGIRSVVVYESFDLLS